MRTQWAEWKENGDSSRCKSDASLARIPAITFTVANWGDNAACSFLWVSIGSALLLARAFRGFPSEIRVIGIRERKATIDASCLQLLFENGLLWDATLKRWRRSSHRPFVFFSHPPLRDTVRCHCTDRLRILACYFTLKGLLVNHVGEE